MNELITLKTSEGGKKTVSGRELHEFLETKEKFADWMQRKINDYDFTENIDFNTITNKVENGRPRKEYIISLEMAVFLCRVEKNTAKSAELLKYFNNITTNNEIIIKHSPRFEHQFGEMLEKITGIEWSKQYPIDNCKYKLDFYLRNVLIVEYDEEQHNSKAEKDDERIRYCREWLNNIEGDGDNYRCPVIRVNKGEELEGLNRIIMHLIGFGIINNLNYNLDICDYGNR